MVEIRGMSQLKKAFDDLGKQMQRNQEIALKLAANEYKSDVQEKAPYKTGTLRRSIHAEPVSPSKFLVGTDVKYARILEYGGVIKAKNAPYLVFKTADGEWHQVKVVHRSPRPYFRPAMDENWEKYQKMYVEAMLGD